MGSALSSVFSGTPAAEKKVFFFDIDNCLYAKDLHIHERMAGLINVYFEKHLNLTPEAAAELHRKYYQEYGLAITGLVKHHGVDPLAFNAVVDDSLPLEDLLVPRPELIELLKKADRSQFKLWLFTNAYQSHARRVVRILGVEELFDGLTYCDYTSLPFTCKPQERMFAKAMADAGVEKMENCYFVDDSYSNCSAAHRLGWNTVHLAEGGIGELEKQASQYQIGHIGELEGLFPEIFKVQVAAA